MAALRQQIRFCTSHDGARIAYATSGEGPPLVKAANWMSHLEFDVESPVWSHLPRELSSAHTLVRYDERGCGLSDWSVADLSFDAWVRDLETVVDAAGVDRFPLLGISQGASIAVAYAVRHPERVTHLIVHSGYARGRLKRGATLEQREEAEAMNKLAELGWGQENPAFRQFFTTQFIPGGTRRAASLVQRARAHFDLARERRALHAHIQRYRCRALLPRITCPTIVLHTTRDARVPFDEGKLIASLIPDARFVPLESGNHLLLETEPGVAALARRGARFPSGASLADRRRSPR